MAKATCSIEGCERQAWAREWCTLHYDRWRRHGDPTTLLTDTRPVEERFWSRVDKTGECWLWTKLINSSGYGLWSPGRGSRWLAHRYAYTIVRGPIPKGYTLDHDCHNRDPDCKPGGCRHTRCVRPDHLTPRTIPDNANQSPHSNARKTHCKNGHAFNAANTHHYADRRRRCRRCHADSEQRRKDRARGI